MLLKLIPTKNEPTIHFSLSFGDLPPQLPAPVSWTAQLSQLMHEDLEVPATLHSLDRATGVSSLLEEVAIDVEAREVRCLFVDGCMERISFGLHGKKHEQALMAAIASIIRDVRESTVEDQQVAKQRDWEKEREKAVSVVNVPVISAPPPAKPGRQGKHKKQRSLFMHIVSSIGSIITPSTSSNGSHSLQNRQRTAGYRNSTSVIPSATTALASPTLPTPGSSPRARALRRAARSALVDTYRRFILDELVRRFYAGPQPAGAREGDVPSMYGLENHHRRERGGFCVWILHSMRRRALIRMEQLLDEAGPAPQEVTRFNEESIPAVCSTTMDVPLSFSDEEDEDGLVDVPLVDSEGHKSSSADEAPQAESQLASSPTTSGDDLPPLPDVSRRASSSSSVGTDDSSDSEATSRSSSSLSCVSTAPSSVDSEPEMKDDTSAELPLTLHLPQYSPRRSSGLSHIHHLSPSARHEYTQLAALRMRLNQLLMFSTSQSRVASEEIRGRLDMLAVRSRRRAWLNKALKTPLAGASGYISAGGGLMLGLATPFRSSPLARYVLTAEDVARRQSSISRSSACSSTSSLSSAYFRSVSASSSATSLPPSPTAPPAKVSFTPFPTSRPRIRPKLDHGALAALTVAEFSDSPDSELQDDAMESIKESQDGLVVTTREEMAETEEEEETDRLDFDVYEEDMARTHAAARTRRHRRSMQEPMMPALPLPSIETRAAGGPDTHTGQDERMAGNNELTLALLARGHSQRGRKSSIPVAKADSEPATFLGCAEVSYTDAQDGEDDVTGQDIMFTLEVGGPTPPSTPTDISTFAADSAPHARPAPRVRTSSMVGALLRGAKGVQRSIVGGLKPQAPLQASGPLNADSLLCQPVSVPASAGVPQPPIVVPSSTPTKLAQGHSAAAPVHACNRRAMDLARPPVAASVYANVDVEMNDVEVNVHLRINDFDASYGAKAGTVVPTPPSPAGDFEQELQKQQTCFAQEQEFTLAMDVAPRGRGVGGGKRWRSRSRSQGQYQEGAPRRPKLTTVFGDGQSALR